MEFHLQRAHSFCARAWPPVQRRSAATVLARENHSERYKLANGLQVILHEDHKLPIVAVNIWYHVGRPMSAQGAPDLLISLNT